MTLIVRMIHEWRIGKDLEGNDLGVIDTRRWHFLRRSWRQRREIAGSPSTRSRCEPRTFVIQARSVPTTTATPDRSVLFRCKLDIYVKVFETGRLVCRESRRSQHKKCEYILLFYWMWRRMVWCMAGFLSVYLRANLIWKYSCHNST